MKPTDPGRFARWWQSLELVCKITDGWTWCQACQDQGVEPHFVRPTPRGTIHCAVQELYSQCCYYITVPTVQDDRVIEMWARDEWSLELLLSALHRELDGSTV